MRVLLIAASTDGYRNPAANLRRTHALLRALERAPAARLVIVPAGYWTARRDREVNDVICDVMHAVFDAIGTRPLTLLGGVDSLPTPSADRIPSLVKRGRLPFEYFALNAGDAAGPWRQISTTSETAPLARAATLDTLTERLLDVDGRRVLPLLCGEMHNPTVRAHAAITGASLVAILGHAGLGQGLVPTLSAVHAITAAPILHTQHLAPRSSGQHHWIDRHGTARHADLSPIAKPDHPNLWISARSIAI